MSLGILFYLFFVKEALLYLFNLTLIIQKVIHLTRLQGGGWWGHGFGWFLGSRGGGSDPSGREDM